MQSKIKILQCIRQGEIGGGETHLLSLIANLDPSLYEPIVLSFTPGPMVDILEQMGVETYLVHTRKPFDVRVWMEVKEIIASTGVHLVHVHGTRAASNVLWPAQTLNLPVIYTVHGWSFHPDQNYWVRQLRIMGEKLLTRNAQVNISVSAANQQAGKKILGGFESLIIRNGIDLNKFNPEKVHTCVRQELGIGADKVVVLFLARFTRQKQPLLLIRSFARAVAANKCLHLLMVGDGDQKKEAIKLMEELKVAQQVTLVPFRQDVPEVLAAADIYVLPSLWEGLPIGLLEAMAMGRAVVATDVDGSNEVVKNRQNGLVLCGSGLESGLTAALKELAANSTLRRKLGAQARQTVDEEFDAALMTKRIEQVYCQLAGAKIRKRQPKKVCYGVS